MFDFFKEWIYYFNPGTDTKYITFCMFMCASLICVSVCCLSARISHKPLRLKFTKLFVLTVTVARSSTHDNAIRYVLPVVWMTSSFHIIAPMTGVVG